MTVTGATLLVAIPGVLLLHGSAPAGAPRVQSLALSDEVGLIPPRVRLAPATTPTAAHSASSAPAAAAPAAARPTQPAQTSSPPPPAAAPATLPSFSHIFVIVMENHEYADIIGNGSAPYINSLAQTYGLAEAYFAVAHPSLPNYLALTAGSTFGISSDCTTCFVQGANIADQVEASGRSWKAYMEDMPAPCYLGAAAGNYALKHDPFLYYTDIRNNPGRCAAHVVPFSQFDPDLRSGAIPNYTWITPNLCNDMHDCAISVGDAWLRTVVPSILASSAWRNGGALFITWDEGGSNAGCCGVAYGGHVATLVISPMGRRAFGSTLAETHVSLLRTIEDAWHLAALRSAAASRAMREFF